MKKASHQGNDSTMVRTLLTFWMIWFLGIDPIWAKTMSQCESLIRRYEAAHGIPHKLLTAISLVESGRKIKGSVVAWPWTINANGKPYVFGSKQEAISMVRRLRQKGVTSIDVGCMQVNLKQHPGAFSTLEAAFDPETNIAYAAKFLKAKKMDKGSWGHAVAHYHSATPKFHVPYRARVFKTWNKVQNGRFAYTEMLEQETSSMATFLADLERHKGQFVKKISTGNGRHVPLIVRFAPYRGFNGGVNKGIIRQNPTKKQDYAPVIFIDGKPKIVGKVIVNKMLIPKSNTMTSIAQRFKTDKIIKLATNAKNKVVKRKSKRPLISKFRS